jgi:hypothetical protein
MVQKIPATVIAVAVLIIIAAIIIVLSVTGSHETVQPARSGSSIMTNTPAPENMKTAHEVVPREGYAGANSTPAGISPAAGSPGTVASECDLTPFQDVKAPDDGFIYYNTSVFTAVSAGNYSSPFTKKDAVLTLEQAKDFARKAFPHYSPDRIDMDFSDGSVSDRAWSFDMYKDDKQLVMGSLDAYTGELMHYRIPSWSRGDTQGVPPPIATTMKSARLTAENEIRERNGNLSLKLVDSRVNWDGSYISGYQRDYFFSYRRIIQGVPCTKDGINVWVDSGTGKVVEYYKAWYTPENAVAAQSVPAISRDAAIALVERKAKACYPVSADSFTIVSADLEWMDLYNQDKQIPLPGVIPLGWYVQFEDKTIRAQEFPVPGEGWVDAQNGTLLSLFYVHRS